MSYLNYVLKEYFDVIKPVFTKTVLYRAITIFMLLIGLLWLEYLGDIKVSEQIAAEFGAGYVAVLYMEYAAEVVDMWAGLIIVCLLLPGRIAWVCIPILSLFMLNDVIDFTNGIKKEPSHSYFITVDNNIVTGGSGYSYVMRDHFLPEGVARFGKDLERELPAMMDVGVAVIQEMNKGAGKALGIPVEDIDPKTLRERIRNNEDLDMAREISSKAIFVAPK